MATALRYQLRPAKFIERQMMADGLRLLGRGFPLSDYTYVGFGALEFVDFRVFHRALGINQMISIEVDSYSSDRYHFNRPFKTIDLKFGRASEVLPTLDWNGLRIVWLDYEQHLDKEVLRDCETVARSLVPGSVLIVTMCCRVERTGERVTTLTRKVGEELVPASADNKALNVQGLPLVQAKIINGVVSKTVQSRGGDMAAQPIFDFHYKDDAPMQTVGWIMSAPNVSTAIRNCNFDQLDFYRGSAPGTDPYEIRVPVLTTKEIHHLRQKLPITDGSLIEDDWLSEADRRDFANFYRWYPEIMVLA